MFDNRAMETASYEYDIKVSEALARLQATDDFKLVFENKFIENFAITNTMLVSDYDQTTRQRTFEKMVGRSVFSLFMSDVHNDGELARLNLKEENDENKELEEAE